MGTQIKIVPKQDWEILQKYLDKNVVLIPEEVLDTLENKAHADALRAGKKSHFDYDFGGEADIWVDIVRDTDHMAWDMIFQDEQPQRFREVSDGFFTYYSNIETGEKKFKLDPGDILVDGKLDDFVRGGNG